MMKLVLFLLSFYFINIQCRINKYSYRELHVLFQVICLTLYFEEIAYFFQKADHNKDRYLDKQEVNHFVEHFMRHIPSIFKDVQTSNDDIEGGKVLADELFNRFDTDGDSKLSYRGKYQPSET